MQAKAKYLERTEQLQRELAEAEAEAEDGRTKLDHFLKCPFPIPSEAAKQWQGLLLVENNVKISELLINSGVQVTFLL